MVEEGGELRKRIADSCVLDREGRAYMFSYRKRKGGKVIREESDQTYSKGWGMKL